MRRDAGEEGGCKFSSKMPRIMSNLLLVNHFYTHIYVSILNLWCIP
jgi:hypothetical protein